MIRVCLVDDQALVRSGIRALLELFDDLEVVAQAADGEAGIEAVLASRPDVLLLDVRMPKLNGVQVVSALAARQALPPTLLLTTFEDDAALVAGVRAGARGYLLKGVTPETLVDAIRTVAGGGTYLYAPLAAAATGPVQEATWRDDAFEVPDVLTERESEVLKLMTSGITNREIALALRLGEGTVRNHVSNIFSKLGVTDRTKAVLYAIQKRLV
ncbi:MAG TPA: response regulator transcription factor [Aliidongia sp.]|uniref:response regulator transcription factor n=1 Tax=Aliidongia sp. TaxID=1914230 RepID=UPI002DDCF396|nr:response regulator transcription factor [Aliidongia sp.]HEV2674922.1 response regulator transcription factor [Aliidongia sp.]